MMKEPNVKEVDPRLTAVADWLRNEKKSGLHTKARAFFFFSAACGRRLWPVLLLPASRSQEAVQYEKVRVPRVAPVAHFFLGSPA